MATITDPVLARALLEQAIALATPPALDAALVDDLFTLAASKAADGVTTVYTMADLNRSAAMGWNQKAALVTDQYDLGAGAGVTLKRAQVFDHCLAMAQSYGAGVMSVTGESSRRAGIRTLGTVGSNVDPVTLINTVVPG